MRKLSFAMLALWVGPVLSACNPAPAPSTGNATTAAAAVPSDPQLAEPTEGEVPLEEKSWQETLEWVARQRGKVVVLDLWSTWCLPCMQEFHHLVALQERFPDDVVCVSVNLNYEGLPDRSPASYREPVHAFLVKQGAAFENVICTDPSDELFARLELASIPAVMVFDREGQLAKRFDNDTQEYGEKGFKYPDHVVPLVERLINGESPR